MTDDIPTFELPYCLHNDSRPQQQNSADYQPYLHRRPRSPDARPALASEVSRLSKRDHRRNLPLDRISKSVFNQLQCRHFGRICNSKRTKTTFQSGAESLNAPNRRSALVCLKDTATVPCCALKMLTGIPHASNMSLKSLLVLGHRLRIKREKGQNLKKTSSYDLSFADGFAASFGT